MVDDCNLGVYNIQQNQRIILKTPHFQPDAYAENQVSFSIVLKLYSLIGKNCK